MVITMKGIFRGLKIIAQIFMQREHEQEIEIGYPTDVRHLSHVGFSATGSCPSWMNEFRVEEVAVAPASSISYAVQSRQTSWDSIDFEQPVVGVSVPPPAEASIAAKDAAAAGTTRGAAKSPAARLKKARGSSARSSSWRSMGSFATACSDSDELRTA